MRLMDSLHIDKRKIIVTTLEADDPGHDWLNKSPLERLAGLEALRQQWGNYDPSATRLPRFYRVAERTWR